MGFDDEDPTVVKDIEGIADIAALAGAFQKEVGSDARPSASPISVSEEWYLGIEGAPVGPLTRDDVRAKAAEGKADENSLVWKDGFEDWKPLRDFPELLSLVEEARQQPTVMAPAAIAPAAGGAVATPAGAEQHADTASAAQAPVGTGTPSVELEDDLSFPSPDFKKRKSSVPMAAWIAVFVALAFGVTIGAVFLSKKEREEVVKYIEVPASVPAQAAQEAPPEEDGEEAEEADEGDESEEQAGGGKRSAGGVKRTSSGSSGTGSKSDEKSGKGGLLAGLNGLQGAGPASGPKGKEKSSSGSGGGGELDSAAVQRTVRKYSQSVRRSCWQPALGTRSKNAPSSARVSVSITVGPSGAVQNVSSSGDPRGYHGLARCIESKVRRWRFPRSSGTTTVKVPFVFAAQ